MCTGSYVDEGTVVPKGTKCASACIFKAGPWGSSYCKTGTSSEEWGGECIPCSGNIVQPH